MWLEREMEERGKYGITESKEKIFRVAYMNKYFKIRQIYVKARLKCTCWM